jgi:hypothetical protein
MSRPSEGFGPTLDYIAQFLSLDDRSAYRDLVVRFRHFVQVHKHSGLPDFANELASIHSFICRSEANQSTRAMICGIFFGPGFILVNTYRLKDLLVRSKSGMNNCFQRLGYDVMRPSNEIISLFEQLLPDLDQTAFQVKQWCLRIETESCKSKFVSHIPGEIAATFETERIPQKTDAKPTPASPDLSPLDVRFLLNRDPRDSQK